MSLTRSIIGHDEQNGVKIFAIANATESFDEDACGDRSPSAHRANLFDLDMKFADVESLAYVERELTSRFAMPRAAE